LLKVRPVDIVVEVHEVEEEVEEEVKEEGEEALGGGEVAVVVVV
jgi:hypothetical protein